VGEARHFAAYEQPRLSLVKCGRASQQWDYLSSLSRSGYCARFNRAAVIGVIRIKTRRLFHHLTAISIARTKRLHAQRQLGFDVASAYNTLARLRTFLHHLEG
jgi:hypothetical protein